LYKLEFAVDTCEKELVPLFGREFFDTNAGRSSTLVPDCMDEIVTKESGVRSKLSRFRTCIEGMQKVANESGVTPTQDRYKAELSAEFGEEWFDEDAHLVSEIDNEHLSAMGQFISTQPPEKVALLTDGMVEWLWVMPSTQGAHGDCAVHAVSFCISQHLVEGCPPSVKMCVQSVFYSSTSLSGKFLQLHGRMFASGIACLRQHQCKFCKQMV